METSKILALCAVVGLILVINLLLFAGFRRHSIVRGLFGDVELYRRAGMRARNPWQEEDDQLKELSRMVEDFKKEEGPREPGDETT
ncbi:MAG TPA: hypothetical protein VJ768_07525 [Anaerolineales bacterium]|nr:hypothetical protein [Anaerolineales bacterium]